MCPAWSLGRERWVTPTLDLGLRQTVFNSKMKGKSKREQGGLVVGYANSREERPALFLETGRKQHSTPAKAGARPGL